MIKTTEAQFSKKYIRIFIALAVVIAFMTLAGSEARAAFKVAVVRSETLNVRSGPGISNSKIGMVNRGDKLFVIKESGDWRQIIITGGKLGWAYKPYLTVLSKGPGLPVKTGLRPIKPPAQELTKPSSGPEQWPVDPGKGQTALVIAENVNIRSGPGTSYQVLAVAAKASRVNLFTLSNGWYSVELSDGTRGWISARYVDARTDVSRGGAQTPSPSAGEQPGAGQPQTPADPVVPPVSADPAVPDVPADPVEPQPIPKLLKMEAVRVDTGGEALVITGEKVISYTVYRLKNPERLVIDINNADKGDIGDLAPGNSDFISQVRAAQFSLTPMTVRLVLDLKKIPAYVAGLSADGLVLTLSLTEPTIKGKSIVLDPGHGGYDPGAVGVTGLKEKEVNLDIALKVQKLLTDMGANVIMTRSDDTFISLSQRATIANSAYADVFVSIHANSNTNPSIGGASVYYYAPSSSPALYSQLARRTSLASRVQSQLVQSLGIRNIGTLTANLAVLRETRMPSILVETAFLSNKAEEALLKDNAFRDKAAHAIAQGLAEYFANPE